MTDYITILCTVPNESTGAEIANELVKGKLAACVNIVPTIRSIYSWKGETCDDSESLLIIKSQQSLFSSLKEKISHLHPYDVPEIICFNIEDGIESYLTWIKDSTT